MTTETATTTPAAAPKTPKAKTPKAKNAPTKTKVKGAKKAAKKAAKKSAAKVATPRAKKEGLRKAQVAVLGILAKSAKPMTRAAIAEKGSLDQASLTGYIGSTDEDKRLDHDKRYFVTLVTLGFVKHVIQQGEAVGHMITDKGLKALAAAKAAE